MKKTSLLVKLTFLLVICCGVALAAFIYKRNVTAKRFEEILNVLESEQKACIIRKISIEPPRTERDKALVTRVIARCDDGEAETFAKRFVAILRKYRDRVRTDEVYNYELPNAYEIMLEGTSSVLNIGWSNPSEPWIEYRIEEPPLIGTIFLEKEARMEIKGLVESLSNNKSRND